MTLNITVVTPKCIFQSADYRLTDVRTRQPMDLESQKVHLVTTFSWSATVCFCGVGRTGSLDIGKWLAERLSEVGGKDTFDSLIEKLLAAEGWLKSIAAPDHRHSFSVGAFIGSSPTFLLISNYENLSGPTGSDALPSPLKVDRAEPTQPTVYLSGQIAAVTAEDKERLVSIAATSGAAPENVYSALAAVNKAVAAQTLTVSPNCYTTHLRLTGDGGGAAQGAPSRATTESLPAGFIEVIRPVLEERFGKGGWQHVSSSFHRGEATDDFHATQLREKPTDPSVHNNFGNHLLNKKNDISGAEREYRRALELEPKHVTALGNLGNLLRIRGEENEAARYFAKALEIDPGNESATKRLALMLLSQRNVPEARRRVEASLSVDPTRGRLHQLAADLAMADKAFQTALHECQLAREFGGDQATVEKIHAVALHASGAPVEACIGAYRTAIALNREDAVLKLNLAQLLFLIGSDEAQPLLATALQIGLDSSAELEAQFYAVAHASRDTGEVFSRVKILMTNGARLAWDMQANLRKARETDPALADRLNVLVQVMTGERATSDLDALLSSWPRRAAR